MALKDYADSHVAVAVAATAAVCSPRMRQMLRRGAVYGVAGALVAGDAVASFARGVRRGAQEAAASDPATTKTAAGTDTPVVKTTDADGSTTVTAQEGAQEGASASHEAGSPRTEAPVEGRNQSTEVNGNE